jgi:DNA (cytosine-5)-methyltransferase 1
MKKKNLNFIDLFCGCGGFSHGLELVGHKCLLGVDSSADAIDSFKINHPHSLSECIDIHKLTKNKLEKLIDFDSVDMVIGGPPCQGFSTVGKGEADDIRNSLFKQFVRIVKLTKPKIILFENVTGILAKKNHAVLMSIFKSFEKLGYQMDAKVLSADDFGVPSRRKRTIIMGVMGGCPVYPEINSKLRKKTVSSALKSLKAKNRKIYNHDIEKAAIKSDLDRKRLSFIPSGEGIRYKEDELKYLPKKLRYDVDWEQISEKRFRQTRLQRLPLKSPAPTILTSRTMYYHPIENRFLTPREAASCQSFPNDFIFSGSVTAQFRQIGNAVPPMLACALGESIRKIKFSKKLKRTTKSIMRDDLTKSAFHYKRAV